MSARTAEELPVLIPAGDFQMLEAKVYRIIDLYKASQEARAAGDRDVKRLREQLEEREEEVQSLRREAIQLRREREEIRSRVEKMLMQIESIADEKAAS